MNSKTVGITLGEPLGIGPEIIVRTLTQGEPERARLRIYGSEALLAATASHLKIKPFWSHDLNAPISIVPVGPEPSNGVFDSSDRELRAQAALMALDRASDDILSGQLSALVTAPIDKSVIRTLIPKFTGHTAHLGERANVNKTFMLLDNTEIRVVLLTEHIPLRKVSEAITTHVMEEAIRISYESYKKWTGKKKLKVAIVGLNPHAGEIIDRSEEELIFHPVIEKMRTPELELEGPFPADSFFSIARGGGWDFILSPYHDQGLVAVKYSGLERVVNITLGLPYLRVSPGHGTAYDIAGQGKADIRSFARALQIAMEGKI